MPPRRRKEGTTIHVREVTENSAVIMMMMTMITGAETGTGIEEGTMTMMTEEDVDGDGAMTSAGRSIVIVTEGIMKEKEW